MSAKRFRIAFSFAGEKRKFVAEVAAILAERFGKDKILYDKYHNAEFSRSDLAFYLPDLALVRQGKQPEALRYSQRAIEIYTRIGSPRLEYAREIRKECED